MKKILLIARSFPPLTGGIENYILSIYSKLPCEVTVVAPYEKGCEEFDKGLGIKVHRGWRLPSLLNKNKFPLLPMFFVALKIILGNKPDQIHCEQSQSGIIGYMFKRVFGMPYIIYAYGVEITGGGGRQMKSLVLNNADMIISISNMTSKALIQRFGIEPSRIKLLHPGVDTKKFRPQINCENLKEKLQLEGKRILLTVGRLSGKEAYKGQDSVIKALPEVLKKVPETSFIIAGTGDDINRLKRLAQKTGVGKNVIFTGYIEENELPQLYNCCDLFIMPSKEKEGKAGKMVEGFGIVFIEAGSCGKPVIGGKSGGIEDAVIDGQTGLLCDPNNTQDIAKKITDLLTNPDLSTQLGNQGRERAIKELDTEIIAQKAWAVIGV